MYHNIDCRYVRACIVGDTFILIPRYTSTYHQTLMNLGIMTLLLECINVFGAAGTQVIIIGTQAADM